MAQLSEEAGILGLTAQIVSAHIAHHDVGPGSLPAFIRDVYKTLSHISEPVAAPAEKAQPAVPIRKSVFPDYIICLEDGKPLKMLKRHLATAYKMTPDQYRQKWGLDPSYPMVAPKYAEKRSFLARQSGLGTRRGTE